jgi:hypothetical protein
LKTNMHLAYCASSSSSWLSMAPLLSAGSTVPSALARWGFAIVD